MRRLMALWMGLALLLGASALGEGTIASYELPDGAQVCFISDAGELAVPEGLEPMYELMQNASLYGDIYLTRMKNGRALVSVSCIPAETPKTAEELLALWPQIAARIALETDYVNDDESRASVEHLYDRDLLHIRTQLAADSLLMEAEAFAFSRGEDMLEVWALYPADTAYLYDAQAAAELESDRADLALFLASLDFSGEAPPAFEGEIYQPSDGRYQIGLPEDAVVISAASGADAIERARRDFIAANEEGADNVFEQMLTDMKEQDGLLILTGDMKGAVTVTCIQDQSLVGVTTEQMLTLADALQQQLQELFGYALPLNEGEITRIAGHEHSLLGYWLRSGECNLQLDVVACILEGGWLCEVDIFTVDGDQELRAQLHTLISQTLAYHVD